jgi:hypothetical protein
MHAIYSQGGSLVHTQHHTSILAPLHHWRNNLSTPPLALQSKLKDSGKMSNFMDEYLRSRAAISNNFAAVSTAPQASAITYANVSLTALDVGNNKWVPLLTSCQQ